MREPNQTGSTRTARCATTVSTVGRSRVVRSSSSRCTLRPNPTTANAELGRHSPAPARRTAKDLGTANPGERPPRLELRRHNPRQFARRPLPNNLMLPKTPGAMQSFPPTFRICKVKTGDRNEMVLSIKAQADNLVANLSMIHPARTPHARRNDIR